VARLRSWFCLVVLVPLCLRAQTPPETVQGRLEVVVEDRFEQGISITYYTLQISTERLELVFPGTGEVEGLTSGSEVELLDNGRPAVDRLRRDGFGAPHDRLTTFHPETALLRKPLVKEKWLLS
jgi:hypothetical protein